MNLSERSLLLETDNIKFRRQYSSHGSLSVIFSIICIVDIFGVYPIISLPKAVIDCGFYGIAVIIGVCSIQMYTAILLGKCWLIAIELDPIIYRKNRYPYSALAELTYGISLSNFVTLLLDLTVFGGGIPNLIVASHNLQLLGLRLSDGNFDLSFCYWIIIIGTILCPILWFGSPKDMKLLCSISVILLTAVFLFVNFCLIFNTTTTTLEIDTNPQLPLWQLIFTLYGIIAFQFDIHPSILTIQVDMNEKYKLNKAVFGGFTVSLAMFLITSIIAFFKLGTTLQSSILESLSTSIALDFAAALVALQLCLSSGVSNNALYQHMEDCIGIPRKFNHRRCILRTTLTLFAILVAESVPRFDLVMSLIGGTLTGPLVFILPPLFYMKILYMRNQQSKNFTTETFNILMDDNLNNSNNKNNGYCAKIEKQFQDVLFEVGSNNINNIWTKIRQKIEIILCVLIILISTSFTITATYVNIINALEFVNFSQPCIYNVSLALIKF